MAEQNEGAWAEIELEDKALREHIATLIKLGNKDVKGAVQRYLNKQADTELSWAELIAERKVGKITGNYRAGFRLGKSYSVGDGVMNKRVYAGKPAYHAGLIEFGHPMSGWAGRSGNSDLVQGRLVFDETKKKFQPKFEAETDKWVTEYLTKRLKE